MGLTRLHTLGLCLLMLVLAWVPLFYHLDQESVRLWDESRVAVNALEMMESGKLLVTTFEDQPDLWHTKPPLAVWMQAASMSLLGKNTLAIRLPSALAGMAMVFMLLWFSIKVIGDWRMGLFGALALLTMRGFVATHVVRTGDTDIFLLCFMLLFWLAWFCHFYGPEHLRQRSVWISALALYLAFMTKSSAALMSLPGLALWMLIDRRLVGVLKNWRVYAGYGAALVGVLGFLLLREWAAPGYLKAMWENDMGGRFGAAIESHTGPWGFYFEFLFREHLYPYVYFLPLALLLNFRRRGSLSSKVTGAALTIGLPYLLVISFAQTKLEWYDAQVYPLAALILGIALAELWQLLQPLLKSPRAWLAAGLMVALCLAIYGQNYYVVYRRNTSFDQMEFEAEAYGYAIQDIHKERLDLEPYKLACVNYNASAYFYSRKWKSDYGLELPIYNPLTTPSDTHSVILCCNPYAMDSLSIIWEAEVLWERFYGCKLLRLKPRPEAVNLDSLPPIPRRRFGVRETWNLLPDEKYR